MFLAALTANLTSQMEIMLANVTSPYTTTTAGRVALPSPYGCNAAFGSTIFHAVVPFFYYIRIFLNTSSISWAMTRFDAQPWNANLLQAPGSTAATTCANMTALANAEILWPNVQGYDAVRVMFSSHACTELRTPETRQ